MMLPVKSRSARLRFAAVFGNGFPFRRSVVRIAGHGLGREIVVRPAVGAPAEHLPDEQASARLKHADISRGIGIPPRADRAAAGRTGRHSPSPAGNTCRGHRRRWADRPSCRRRAPSRPPARSCSWVWQATQLRSKIGLTSRIILDVLDPLFVAEPAGIPLVPLPAGLIVRPGGQQRRASRSGRRCDNRAVPPRFARTESASGCEHGSRRNRCGSRPGRSWCQVWAMFRTMPYSVERLKREGHVRGYSGQEARVGIAVGIGRLDPLSFSGSAAAVEVDGGGNLRTGISPRMRSRSLAWLRNVRPDFGPR